MPTDHHDSWPRRDRFKSWTWTLILALGCWLSVGCGGGSDANRSPLASDDPAKAERARQQVQSAEEAAREAEANFFRSRGAAPENAEGATDTDTVVEGEEEN